MTKAAADVRLVVEKLAEAMALGIDPAEVMTPAPTTTPPEEQPAPLQYREEPERPSMPWDYQEEPDVVPAEKPTELAPAPAPPLPKRASSALVSSGRVTAAANAVGLPGGAGRRGRRVMTGRLDTETIARARAVPVADEIHRRRIPLRRVGLELVGACPVCGDGGKGALGSVRRLRAAPRDWARR
jgi:hypothetical protein